MRRENEYRKSIDEYRSALPIRRKLGPYWILVALRVIVTLTQTGYIHPDEYFQSIEVISGDHFDINVYKPWEFNSTAPIRSIVFPKLIVGSAYYILKLLSPYTFYYLGFNLQTPYFLVALPRLLMCCLSFVSDYCLYKICCMFGQNYRTRLIILSSSYVMLVYATRTFSNSIELVLTSLLLYFTSHCMAYSEKIVLQSDFLSKKYDRAKNPVERVKYYKLRASLPSHSLNYCLQLSTITVIGIFNRPTFIAFAFPPIFFWLQRGLGSLSVGFKDFNIRIFTFMVYAIPSTVLMIVIDSFYYGHLTLIEIMNYDIGMKNFVVTPLNFLKYNMNIKNLKNHGLHPWYFHILINVPLLFNVIGIMGTFRVGKLIYRGLNGQWLDLPRIQSIVSLMTISYAVPIAILSLIPHQEPRFIIPVILPLVFLGAPLINNVPGVDTVARITKENLNIKKSKERSKPNKLKVLWYICNIFLCIFYGFIHQGGVLPLTSHLTKELKAKPELTHVHLYTSYSYPIPTALLHLKNTKRTYISTSKYKFKLKNNFYLYEQGSRDTQEVYQNIVSKLNECQENLELKKISYRIYYAIPATALEKFTDYSRQNISQSINFKIVRAFYPHISIESIPSIDTALSFPDLLSINYLSSHIVESIVNEMSIILKQFQLLLLKIEISKGRNVKYT